MNRIQIFFLYLLAGPLVGGLLVVAAVAITTMPPLDMLVEMVVTGLIFAYPLGLFAALGAGAAHLAMSARLKALSLVAYVTVAGLLGHIVTMLLMTNASGLMGSPMDLIAFVTPPIVSALIICSAILLFERRHCKPALSNCTK